MKKGHRALLIVSVLVLSLLAILAIGMRSGRTTRERVAEEGGQAAKPERVAEEGQAAKPEPIKQGPFVVGETVRVGQIEFTLRGVRFVAGDESHKPPEGYKWIAFDCLIENKSDEAITIWPGTFELFDPGGFRKEPAWGVPGLRGSLEFETIGGRRGMAGEIAFYVGEGETEWEFALYTEHLGHGHVGQVTYRVSIDDIK